MVLFYLSLSSLVSYLLSLTPLVNFLPQLIALLSLLFIFSLKKKLPAIYIISAIINLIVFAQNGVQSSFFFLIYFLLFIVALQYPPAVSLSFSLVVTILLTYSTNSLASLIPILSLLFITPVVWLIGRQTQTIAVEETDFLLWLNLKFKSGITAIIDLSSQLQSTPLSYNQKEQLKKIRSSAKSLLNSSEKLSQEIGDNDQTNL